MRPIAYATVDGKLRPVYILQGRQCVEGDDGEPIFDLYFIPPEECLGATAQPVIVTAPRTG